MSGTMYVRAEVTVPEQDLREGRRLLIVPVLLQAEVRPPEVHLLMIRVEVAEHTVPRAARQARAHTVAEVVAHIARRAVHPVPLVEVAEALMAVVVHHLRAAHLPEVEDNLNEYINLCSDRKIYL